SGCPCVGGGAGWWGVVVLLTSLRAGGGGRGFRGRPGAPRARDRFVNLVAALLRFPSLGPEAPRHPRPPATTCDRSSSSHRRGEPRSSASWPRWGEQEQCSGPRGRAAQRGPSAHSVVACHGPGSPAPASAAPRRRKNPTPARPIGRPRPYVWW